MREQMREQLNKEITRKEFIRYMAGALLLLFGFNNFLALLHGPSKIFVDRPVPGGNVDGFGARRFGV